MLADISVLKFENKLAFPLRWGHGKLMGHVPRRWQRNWALMSVHEPGKPTPGAAEGSSVPRLCQSAASPRLRLAVVIASAQPKIVLVLKQPAALASLSRS